TEFLKIGASNDPNEVRKLQYFLNVYEGNNLPIDGVFGTSTEAAVATFQLKYASDILAPWGISTPTGIVYITTSRKINEIYCGDHPNYQGNQDLKDILQNNVLNSPSQYNPSQFNNAIGYGTTSSSSLANIAGVLGGLSQKVLDALKQIPIYPLLILILLLLGAGFTIQGTSIKDIGSNKSYTAFMRGIALVTVGSVLNVLNTLSFMLNPAWLSNNVGLDLRWVLGLDMANAIVVIAIAVSGLIALYTRSTQSSKDVAGGPHTPLAK
ncbi:MAG: peptidoglycan-binding protein, partial [Patescibacteria group bacterium]|nr:peptidoglycan-binding protein [Patescibacteria group bacterium]